MSKFSITLKMLRKETHVSQQSLASFVGVSQQCVSEWEKDNIEPTLSNLVKIADFFDVSLDFLSGRKDY